MIESLTYHFGEAANHLNMNLMYISLLRIHFLIKQNMYCVCHEYKDFISLKMGYLKCDLVMKNKLENTSIKICWNCFL